MMRMALAAALAALTVACGDTNTTIIQGMGAGGASSSASNGGLGGLGGAGGDGGEAGQGGAASSSTGSVGGAGGQGGGGGGPCVPMTCADIHGACGMVDDGCGTPIDCTDPCSGTGVWMACVDGVCACNPANSVNEAKQMCTSNAWTPGIEEWCGPNGCDAFFCSETETGGEDAPVACKYVGQASPTAGVWCCPL